MDETSIEGAFLPPCSYCLESERFFAALKTGGWPQSLPMLDFNLCCDFHKALLFIYIYIDCAPGSVCKTFKNGGHHYPWYHTISVAGQVASNETILNYVKSQWALGSSVVGFIDGKPVKRGN